jgi:hypothetical protein
VAQLKQIHHNLQGPRTVAGYLHRMLNPVVAGMMPVQFSSKWQGGSTYMTYKT